jgi:hypothetical protein
MRLTSPHGIVATGVRANSASRKEEGGETPVRDGEELARPLLRKADEHRARFDEGDVLFVRDPTVAHELGLDHPDSEALVAGRHYLRALGYIERADIGVAAGTFVVTGAGTTWMGNPPRA